MKTEENKQEAAKKIAETLNGVQGAHDFKLITLTIQDANPITFSEQCEEALKNIHPDSLVSYSVQNIVMNVNRGQQALVFVANFQYWTDKKNHSEWVADIKRANLLIKP